MWKKDDVLSLPDHIESSYTKCTWVLGLSDKS